MKTLGIIGGLGPMATALLLEQIIQMTDVKTDQEHLDIIVFNRPNTPDRTEYLLDRSKPSPAVSITETAQTLEKLGASYLAIPCVTAHALLDELKPHINLPIINMVEATAASLYNANMRKTGVMATTGTVKIGLFQSALNNLGIEPVIPENDIQTMIMELIYDDVKAGIPADMDKFRYVSDWLFSKGCDSIILGCTELSVIKKQESPGNGFIDALEVLAAQSILLCGKPLKPAYSTLIQRR